MNTLVRPVAAGLLVLALVLVSGCEGSAVDSGGEQEQSRKIRMASGSKLITDWDDYVAEAKGYYEKYEVTVDRISTQTAAQAVQLQVSGAIDVGRGMPPAIQTDVKSKGAVQLVSVADLLVHPPFTMNASKKISSYEDMAGTKVAVSSPIDSTTVVARTALAALDVDTSSIDFVPAGGTAERLAGLRKGVVSSTPMLPPVNFKAESAGYHRIGYLPDDLGPEWKFAFTSVVVEKKWAKKHGKLLVDYLAARDDALKFMADKENRKEVAHILAEATDIDDATALEVYDLVIGGEINSFPSRIGVDEDAIGGLLDGLKAGGFVGDEARVDQFVDDSYAAQVRRGDK